MISHQMSLNYDKQHWRTDTRHGTDMTMMEKQDIQVDGKTLCLKLYIFTHPRCLS